MEFTDKEIEDLKKKHGAVFLVEVDGKSAILKKPDRKILQAANRHSADPIRMAEVILANCWVKGDEEIKTDDELFIGAANVLGEVVEFKQAEIKKL